MRAIFGVVSLLVVLAVVGLVAVKQLKAVDRSVGAALPPAQGGVAEAASPTASAPIGVRAKQAQERVVGEVTKSLEQGAARSDEAVEAAGK